MAKVTVMLESDSNLNRKMYRRARLAKTDGTISPFVKDDDSQMFDNIRWK